METGGAFERAKDPALACGESGASSKHSQPLRIVHRPILVVNFHDPRLLDDRRFPLAFGIISGFHAIRVDAGEFLSVAINDGHAIVTMSASLVFTEGRFATLFPTFHLRTPP
jgi:hypothetical protein